MPPRKRFHFDIVPTRFLLEEEVRAADPNGLSFLDIDTPDDYERAKQVGALEDAA